MKKNQFEDIIKKREMEHLTYSLAFTSKNKALASGILGRDIEYSHTFHGEVFYKTEICVERLSKQIDKIPVIISEGYLEENCIEDFSVKGKWAEVAGSYCSCNHDGHVLFYLYAKKIFLFESKEDLDNPMENMIYLSGFICNEPVYKITPAGREITGFIVAVCRPYYKKDYIYCISWGNNAKVVKSLDVGTHVEIYGRMQSRKYLKHASEKLETKEAYEVSVMKICII